MEFGLIPTLASLGFLIVLSLVYFSKIKIKNTINLFYRIYIYTIIFFSLTELIYSYLLLNTNVTWLIHIFWRIHWALGAFAWSSLLLYMILIIKNIKVNNFKELFNNKAIKLIMICYAIVSLAILFFPVNNYLDLYLQKELLFSNNIVNLIEIIYSSITLLIILIYFLKNKKEVNKTCKFAVIIFIVNSIVFYTLQVVVPGVSFYDFLFVVMAYILYFCFANPDIEIIKQINIAQDSIRKTSQTKTNFLSNMSTEIKIPIEIINKLCDTLSSLKEFNQEEAKDIIRKMITSGENLLDIVNNVVDISKIESGKVKLIEKEYNLKDLIENIKINTINKIENKNIKFFINIDPNISSVLIGDYNKLYQSILNITNNAAKYTEVGKIIVDITSKKDFGYEILTFKISDTGPGIKEEEKAHLFDKGVKLDNVDSNIERTGYGLSIAKDYIEELNGKIWFTSDYYAGSTFYVEVRQKIKNNFPIGQVIKSEKNNQKQKIDCTGKKVLLVDDNKPNIKVMKRLLEKYNIEVESVLNGQDCIYKIKSENKYDLIFMDHVMEEMDGIETLRVLKGLKDYKLPPVIVLTANSISDMEELYKKEGFQGYLSKPVNLNELDKIVNKYLK